MSRRVFLILAGLLMAMTALGPAASVRAQFAPMGVDGDEPNPVTAEAVFMADAVAAGNPTAVAVTVQIAEPYHINPDPARSGPAWFEAQYPTTLKLIDPPAGVQAGPVQYPEPHDYEVAYADQTIQVYDGTVVLYLPLLLDADVPAGPMELKLELEYQACDPQVCLIPDVIELTATVEVAAAGAGGLPGALPGAISGSLPGGGTVAEDRRELFADFDPAGWALVGEADPAGAPDDEPLEGDAAAGEGQAVGASTTTLGWTLLIAVAAGFLLNFTPCVLPVVPLKVMSLAQHAPGSAPGINGRQRTIVLSLVMAAGIVGFWLAIALAMVGLKQFQAINQLFQYPAFNLAVGVVIAVLAVSMLGLFTIDLPRAVYQFNPTGDTVTGSFGFGVMTAVLATPCAGPLMGGAVVWATQQGVGLTLLTFGALGLGMALPYLVLTLFPGWIEKLPRAGAGSELLKQTMGVLMLAAAAFFIGTGIVALTSDGTQATGKGYWIAVGGLIAAAGGWLIVRGWAAVCRTMKGKALAAACGLALIVAGGWVAVDLSQADPSNEEMTGGGGGIAWVYYTPDRLAEATEAGQVVVLDFTADWCLNCKALEKTVLESDAVRGRLAEPGVVPMKVDITSARNVDGNALLKAMGRVTIPLLVVLDGGGDEVFKADFYTIAQVTDAIDAATQTAN
jgi:thiol:disulfide interchange protein DsbD